MRSYPLLKIPTIADPAHVSDVMHVNAFHSSNQTYYILPNYSFSSWQTNNIVALAVVMFILNISNKQNFNVTEALFHTETGERGGSVVECRTPEREVRGSRPNAAVLCPWARHFTPRKYWLITQEAMAPSRYDWKIVDWDVKPQHNQPNHTETWPSSSQLTFMTVNNVKPFTQALTHTSSDIHGIRKTICTPIHVFKVPHYVWLKIFAQTSSNHHLIRA